jgi:hypothetical protein
VLDESIAQGIQQEAPKRGTPTGRPHADRALDQACRRLPTPCARELGSDSCPRGQCRTQLPRVLRPVLLLADVLAIDAHATHVAAIAFMRSPSLTAAAARAVAPAARAVADPPLSAALSLSASCTNTSAVAPMACCRRLCVARTRMREIVRGQGVARTQ